MFKHCTLLLAVVLLLNNNLAAQCPPGNVTFLSQAEVDAFVATYPNCTTINGILSIGSTTGVTDITDLTGLSAITTVNGFLRIRNNSLLTNLNGLNAITSINGFLRIRGNSILTNITGLENIDPNSITGLIIRNNNQLSSCAIESVCLFLDVAGNPALVSNNAVGCTNLAQVVNACSTCPFGVVTLLTQAEVDAFAINYPNCTQLTGSIKIGNGIATTNISDLSGLSNLTSIGNDLILFFNDNLNTLEGLDALTAVGGKLLIYRNNALSDMTGLNSLATVSGPLSFFRNDGLINMNGLNALTQTGSYLIIRSNAALTNLGGLETLNEIGGFLAIRENSSLTNLQGLVNVDPMSIDGLYITDNPLLSLCAIENICTYLVPNENIAQIAHNANMCNTRVQVENACDIPFAAPNIEVPDSNPTNFAPLASAEVKIKVPTAQIELYPNPTSGLLQVRNVVAKRVLVFSPQGQGVALFESPGNELDLSTLAPGVYYLNFITAEGSFTERVVKVN